MEQQEKFIIHISGFEGGQPLTPENYDIRQLKELLENVDVLLCNTKKKDRPIVSYSVESGSVRHVFHTTMQIAVQVASIIGLVQTKQSLDVLDLPAARAIEAIQKQSLSKGYSIDLSTTIESSPKLTITPATNYHLSESVWVNSEFYLYGVLTDIGGKNNPSIHLDVNGSQFNIIATKSQLTAIEGNPLYKQYGVRVLGRQKSNTGEMDKQNLKLVDIKEYRPRFDADYLDELIKKATPVFTDIKDPDAWVRELRGIEA